MVQLVNAPLAIGLDALSFLVAALFLAAIRTPEAPPHTSSTRREGIGGVRIIPV